MKLYDQKQQIVEALETKQPIAIISQNLGCSTQTLRNRIEKFGLTDLLKATRTQDYKSKVNWSDPLVIKELEQCLVTGKSNKQAAEYFDVTRERIRQVKKTINEQRTRVS